MTITLDAKTEQRIQRELARGNYSDPGELITHALDLVAAEEDWLIRNKAGIEERLEVSFAQARRGEGHSLEAAREILAAHRKTRSA